MSEAQDRKARLIAFFDQAAAEGADMATDTDVARAMIIWAGASAEYMDALAEAGVPESGMMHAVLGSQADLVVGWREHRKES